jgi:PAS domain S-box-containing protein
LAEKIRVLHVEDNRDHALLIRRSLERQDPDLEIVTVASAEEALEVMERDDISVVLSDYALGSGMNGLELLASIRDRDARMPFILLTGQGNEEVAANALRMGASDYIIKRSGSLQFNRLAVILRNQCEMYSARRDRDAAEERARVADDMFKLIFENANEAVFLSELDGRILEANSAAIRLTGYSLDELRSMSVQDLHTPSERYISETELEKVRRGDFYGFVAMGRCKDGSEKKCAVTGNTVKAGDRQLLLGLVMELQELRYPSTFEETERRIAAEADARFKMAIEQAPLLAVQGYDTGGKVTYWNRASEDLYGFNRLEVLGKTLGDLILDEEEARRFDSELQWVIEEARPSRPQEWSTHDRWGTERWVYSTMFPIVEDGKCREVFCVDLDITSRKGLEAELMERNTDLEAFAHTVSHDLRAPLSSLDGFAHLLRESTAGRLTPEETEYLDRIVNSSAIMDTLIASMLEFALSERGGEDLEPVDLEVLVREIWMDLERAYEGSGASLRTSFGGTEVHSDPVLLRQVLANLMDNALKFNTKPHPPLIEAGLRYGGGEFAIFVKDNGPGIPPEEREAVFSPFRRLSSDIPGLGIGLSTVKRAVESWGGRVWLESDPESGSTFFFTIPEIPGP